MVECCECECKCEYEWCVYVSILLFFQFGWIIKYLDHTYAYNSTKLICTFALLFVANPENQIHITMHRNI